MMNLQTITIAEAQRLGVPAAATCAGLTVLALPGGGVLEMPASSARDAAAALLLCAREEVAEVSCWDCRHALVCSQLAGVRSALTLREYLNDEGGIWRAIAGSCQLFETAETGVFSPISTTDTGAQ